MGGELHHRSQPWGQIVELQGGLAQRADAAAWQCRIRPAIRTRGPYSFWR